MTPALSYLIPLFMLFQLLGLTGTLWPMVIIHLVITVPIVVYIMVGFFETLPRELEEAAHDRRLPALWQAFRHVALPLGAPGHLGRRDPRASSSPGTISSSAPCSAGRETRTLPVAVYNMLTFEQIAWGPLAAAALIVTLPVLILTIAARRRSWRA